MTRSVGAARSTLADETRLSPRPRTATSSASWEWLRRRNPLAKLVAVLPAIVWVLLSESPAVSLGCGAVAALALVTGVRIQFVRILLGAALLPGGIVVLSFLFALWIDPAAAATGAWTDAVDIAPGVFGIVTLSSLLAASETALRIAAILLLSLLCGAGSTRTGLTDALMQNARLPYRIGYMAYAASGNVARLAEQRRIIRAAQRVRGGGTRRGPIAAVAPELDTAVALLIDALRHSERMALALESRSFGVFDERTWRRVVRWTGADTAYVAAAITVTVIAAATIALVG